MKQSTRNIEDFVQDLIGDGENVEPFALVWRRGAHEETVEVLRGPVSELSRLDEISAATTGPQLVVVPYRQVVERGYCCVDDKSPLIRMEIDEATTIAKADLLRYVSGIDFKIAEVGFDRSDTEYCTEVEAVQREIEDGEGANFVLKRSYVCEIDDYSARHALALFGRLLEDEPEARWIFLVFLEDRALVGATPESHLVLSGGRLQMNPISGTYCYPAAGPSREGVIDFLRDGKESDELFMVVDEELKMMTTVCDSGIALVGPHLREMARLAHTEYVIEGVTSRSPAELLRATMFAPTVVGSPIENACRVVARHEPEGRGYYAGVIALVDGDVNMDSAILIRFADINPSGVVRVSVGSTIVRHSVPEHEAGETRAKAETMLAALRGRGRERLGDDAEIRDMLANRNRNIAGFWREPHAQRHPGAVLDGRSVLVIDAEDDFTSMLEYQLNMLGLDVTRRRWADDYNLNGYDVVVLGPGPGSPLDWNSLRVARLHTIASQLLAMRKPFVAVCLSHQIVCAQLGLPVRRRKTPNQGRAQLVDLFGKTVSVGFYNSFSAWSAEASSYRLKAGGLVDMSRDEPTGEVHALSGPTFRSYQFHPESVLSYDGASVLHDSLVELLVPECAALVGVDLVATANGGEIT